MEGTHILTAYKYKRLNNANDKIAFALASTENKPSYINPKIEIEIKPLEINTQGETNGKQINTISLWTNNQEIKFTPSPGNKPNVYLSGHNPNYQKNLDKYKILFNVDSNELLILEQLPTNGKC